MPFAIFTKSMSSPLFLLSVLISGSGAAVAGCGILGPGADLTAEGERGSRDPLDQLIGVTAVKDGPEICFDNLKNKQCSGGVRDRSKNKIAFFSGATCEPKGLTSDAKAGDKIAITCDFKGKSCFAGAGIESNVAIEGTLTAAFDGNEWRTGAEPGIGVQTNRLEKTCQEAFGVKKPENPPQQGGGQAECEVQTPAAPLRLANEAPPVSECLKTAGPARMNCLLQQNDAEVYEYSSSADVLAIKQGQRSPNRCYSNYPNASSTSKHLFVYLSGGGYKGAIALGTAGVGFPRNSLRYDFTRHYQYGSQGPYPGVSVGRSFDGLTPSSDNGGEPDLATGVWVMDNRTVARFVPKNWCAQKYLGIQDFDLNQLQSIQLDAKPPVTQPGGGQTDPNPQPGDGSTKPPCTPKTKQ